MALTLTEIQKIYDGKIKPEETSLRDLIAIAGVRHHNWFLLNEKSTDVDTLARAYADKLKSVMRQLINRNIEVAKTVTYHAIILGGNKLDISYASMEAYTTTDWEEFVDDNIISGLEVAAGISPNEKTAYNGL